MKSRNCACLVLIWILVACHPAVTEGSMHRGDKGRYQDEETPKRDTCLTQADAERILGQPATQKESSSKVEDGVFKSRCTYTANAADPQTDTTTNLYYLLQHFPKVDAAQKAYEGMVAQNGNLPGMRLLTGLEYPAFLHTDNENFVLITSLKENKILSLKVNKRTSRTSLSALQNTSMNITSTL